MLPAGDMREVKMRNIDKEILVDMAHRSLALAIIKQAVDDMVRGDEEASDFFYTELYDQIRLTMGLPDGNSAIEIGYLVLEY